MQKKDGCLHQQSIIQTVSYIDWLGIKRPIVYLDHPCFFTFDKITNFSLFVLQLGNRWTRAYLCQSTCPICDWILENHLLIPLIGMETV